MVTKITEGVKISVETFYQEEHSQPLNNEFMFAYRITIQWWVFLAAGIAACLIALITTGFQAVRAAMANPVKSLRSE